jgi:hypothetical protein
MGGSWVERAVHEQTRIPRTAPTLLSSPNMRNGEVTGGDNTSETSKEQRTDHYLDSGDFHQSNAWGARGATCEKSRSVSAGYSPTGNVASSTSPRENFRSPGATPPYFRGETNPAELSRPAACTPRQQPACNTYDPPALTPMVRELHFRRHASGERVEPGIPSPCRMNRLRPSGGRHG